MLLLRRRRQVQRKCRGRTALDLARKKVETHEHTKEREDNDYLDFLDRLEVAEERKRRRANAEKKMQRKLECKSDKMLVTKRGRAVIRPNYLSDNHFPARIRKSATRTKVTSGFISVGSDSAMPAIVEDGRGKRYRASSHVQVKVVDKAKASSQSTASLRTSKKRMRADTASGPKERQHETTESEPTDVAKKLPRNGSQETPKDQTLVSCVMQSRPETSSSHARRIRSQISHAFLALDEKAKNSSCDEASPEVEASETVSAYLRDEAKESQPVPSSEPKKKSCRSKDAESRLKNLLRQEDVSSRSITKGSLGSTSTSYIVIHANHLNRRKRIRLDFSETKTSVDSSACRKTGGSMQDESERKTQVASNVRRSQDNSHPTETRGSGRVQSGPDEVKVDGLVPEHKPQKHKRKKSKTEEENASAKPRGSMSDSSQKASSENTEQKTVTRSISDPASKSVVNKQDNYAEEEKDMQDKGKKREADKTTNSNSLPCSPEKVRTNRPTGDTAGSALKGDKPYQVVNDGLDPGRSEMEQSEEEIVPADAPIGTNSGADGSGPSYPVKAKVENCFVDLESILSLDSRAMEDEAEANSWNATLRTAYEFVSRDMAVREELDDDENSNEQLDRITASSP